jgi:hypothetical protein|tara:strand:- start:457 stop:885 length:429 start_codon:yes stop_codon:yes gene_type:complete
MIFSSYSVFVDNSFTEIADAAKIRTKRAGGISYRDDMAVTNPFTRHPHSAGESYFQHMRVAVGFARQTIGAGMCALVHAIFPMFHQTAASERIQCLAACIESGDRDAITIVKAARIPPNDNTAAAPTAGELDQRDSTVLTTP